MICVPYVCFMAFVFVFSDINYCDNIKASLMYIIDIVECLLVIILIQICGYGLTSLSVFNRLLLVRMQYSALQLMCPVELNLMHTIC